MEYNSKSLTREGATMLALADKEEKALIIDEVIVSEKVITAGTDISALTMADFANPLTYGISSKVQSDNQFIVKSVITNHWQDSANTDHTTNKDFNVALVGVVAHVDSFADQHVLTVAVGNDPFVLPAYQGTDVSFVFGITQAYSASQNVTIKMDGSAYALATDLDDIKNLQGSIGIAIDSKLADYVKTDEVKSLIPATVIDGSKPADFKEAVTLEKGAVDGEGNAIATAKGLADGDAETLTSAKAYADTQASDKVKDADTAGGRNLIAQSNSVAGYMVSVGTLYADTLTSGERTSDFISVDIAKPYSLGVRVTLPANTQFWYAFSLFDKNKKFIKRMAATGPMSTDGGIDEERYWLLAPGDTRKSPLYNFTEDTAYVRVSWRSYDNAKVSFSRGLYPEDYVPAPEDKVSVSDTASWQKAKITGDDGSPKSFLYAKDNGNITMWIAGRPLGMHTFWCAAGVAGNPVSSSIQGTMSISSVKNGVGYCVSADGDFISITLVDGQVNYDILTKKSDIDPSVIVKTTLTASDDVLNLDYGSYTISGPLPKNAPDLENTGINWGTLVVLKTLSGANKTLEYRDVKGNVLINILSGKPLTWSGWHMPNENSVVKDNGDGTVTVDGRKFVPADTDHTIPVSEAGVAGPANFAAGTLKVDDLEVLGAKVFSDTEDYKTFAAAHPSAITIVTHDTSTS